MSIKCRKCNHVFAATPGSLLLGHACPVCSNRNPKSQEEFIAEMKLANPSIQIDGIYKNSKTKIAITCLKCGHNWTATPNSLLRKKGCPKCAGTMKKTHDEFVQEMLVVHPDIIVLGKYKNTHTKIHCKCSICNTEFDSTPHSMLSAGNGCWNCNKSNGEKHIEVWLKNARIKYISEYRFDDCKDIYPLPFDFYIPDKKVVIEYDGKQHFICNDFFGGEVAFTKLKIHDNIKNDFCSKNNIKIIRIPYTEYPNIEKILSRELTCN